MNTSKRKGRPIADSSWEGENQWVCFQRSKSAACSSAYKSALGELLKCHQKFTQEVACSHLRGRNFSGILTTILAPETLDTSPPCNAACAGAWWGDSSGAPHCLAYANREPTRQFVRRQHIMQGCLFLPKYRPPPPLYRNKWYSRYDVRIRGGKGVMEKGTL